MCWTAACMAATNQRPCITKMLALPPSHSCHTLHRYNLYHHIGEGCMRWIHFNDDQDGTVWIMVFHLSVWLIVMCGTMRVCGFWPWYGEVGVFGNLTTFLITAADRRNQEARHLHQGYKLQPKETTKTKLRYTRSNVNCLFWRIKMFALGVSTLGIWANIVKEKCKQSNPTALHIHVKKEIFIHIPQWICL